MKECRECAGTGLTLNDRYCKCINGRELKVKTLSDKIRPTNTTKTMSAEFNRIKLEVGDWVEHNGVIGSVVVIDEPGNQFKLISSPKYARKFQAWVTYRGQTPLPLERFDDPGTIEQLIDLALMFKDKIWFEELVGGVK